MKIILANKYLYPRGGDCQYTLRLMALLQQHGHTVIPFTMNHPQNISTGYEKYFASHIDFNDELKKRNPINALRVSSRAVVNIGAAHAMRQLIEDYRPDIVHLQNIHHQLTPAIAMAATSCGVPVIWTMHDYILACPNDNLLRNGRICTECVSGNNFPAVLHRCKKGSLGASVLAALERAMYKPERLARVVSRFICPSRFMADMLRQAGIAENKIACLPNFLVSSDIQSTGDNYFFYAGRLTIEKGIETLIKAFGEFGRGKLIIAGDGPQREHLQLQVERAGIRNIDFVGYQSPESIQKLLAGCLATIVPSIWYENLPYAVMEAMAAGKPVIASRIGGIPEMIEHQINGLLFDPGNSDQLAEMLNIIWNNREMAVQLGQAGKNKVANEYSGENHYQNLISIYQQALDTNHCNILEQSTDKSTISSEQYSESMKG